MEAERNPLEVRYDKIYPPVNADKIYMLGEKLMPVLGMDDIHNHSRTIFR